MKRGMKLLTYASALLILAGGMFSMTGCGKSNPEGTEKSVSEAKGDHKEPMKGIKQDEKGDSTGKSDSMADGSKMKAPEKEAKTEKDGEMMKAPEKEAETEKDGEMMKAKKSKMAPKTGQKVKAEKLNYVFVENPTLGRTELESYLETEEAARDFLFEVLEAFEEDYDLDNYVLVSEASEDFELPEEQDSVWIFAYQRTSKSFAGVLPDAYFAVNEIGQVWEYDEESKEWIELEMEILY